MAKDRKQIETVLGKRLRTAASQSGMSVAELAEKSGVSESGIKKLMRGETRTPRADTLSVLAKALEVPEEFFSSEANDHTFSAGAEALALLEKTYGPSVRSALEFGTRHTLWLAYDTVGTLRYDEDKVFARISDREPNLPKLFLSLRKVIETENKRRQANRKLGKPYFDGPTLCLSRYDLTHSEDGHETKTLTVEFSKSRYANNVTAKSATTATLRQKVLREFKFLDQPIEWLASGVGVAIVVFCDGGTKFVVAQRSEHERFRSLEYDISVVEGINPIKDAHPVQRDRVYVYDAVRRAVKAELGLSVSNKQVNVIGFGVDLEYYQWNFLAYVDVDLSFKEVKAYWQHAEEKFEAIDLYGIEASPDKAAAFCAENPIWSAGMAALYVSLIKRARDPKPVHDAFAKAFSGT